MTVNVNVHSSPNGRLRERPAKLPVVLDARVVCGSGGGPDKTILNSPRFLEALGYRNLCAYMHPPGDPGFEVLRKKAERWHAPLVSILDRGPWDVSVLPQLLSLCRRERVDVWHGHDYKSNLLGLVLERFWPMRLVTTVHGWVMHTRRTPLYYRIDRWCLPRYEKVICVSADLLQRALECGTPPERCLLLENGVDTQEFRRRRSVAAAKERLGIPQARFLIGSAGRLSAEKGFDILIRSVDQLLHEGRDVQLLVVGEGEQAAALRALVNQLGRPERVQLLGYRADLRELYEAMDVFALSSLREGLPNVLLEAMAMEVPVVATRIAGIPRLIRDDVVGQLVEAGDVAQLTHALGRMQDDAERRQRLARAGLETVRTAYSFAARMDKIRLVYDEVLGKRSTWR